VRLLSDDLRDTLRTARKKYDMGRALAAHRSGTVRVVLVRLEEFRATMSSGDHGCRPDDFQVGTTALVPEPAGRVTRAYKRRPLPDLKARSDDDLEGPMAELLQHGLDHLDGILALTQPAGSTRSRQGEWEKPQATSVTDRPRPRELDAQSR